MFVLWAGYRREKKKRKKGDSLSSNRGEGRGEYRSDVNFVKKEGGGGGEGKKRGDAIIASR